MKDKLLYIYSSLFGINKNETKSIDCLIVSIIGKDFGLEDSSLPSVTRFTIDLNRRQHRELAPFVSVTPYS